MSTEMTRWAVLPGYPTYQASSSGHVRSIARIVTVRPTRGMSTTLGTTTRRQPGRVLTPSPAGSRGYPTVTLSSGCRVVQMKVAVAVLTAFIGPRPPGAVPAHKDGDVTNCALANLYWKD